MVYDREAAALRAEASRSNAPGTCQLWTRTIFGAPSAGDQDHDGDADAVDGWKSEPVSARHPGDRHPPRGVPVAWSGGSHGFGHRAISLGNGKIRSTDAGGSGVVATVDLGWVEQHWGLTYSGWSETIDGVKIPLPPKPDPDPADRTTTLHVAHCSMQYSDSDAAKKADLNKIFSRCQDRRIAWLTGTEASSPAFAGLIESFAHDHGYRFASVAHNDTWIAVRKDLIKGNWSVDYEKVLEAGAGSGTHAGDRGILAAGFDTSLGRITVLTAHYLRYGRPDARDPDYKVNVSQNRKLAAVIGKKARLFGQGKKLVFFGGDMNIPDKDSDTFMGQPLTSVWDELSKYENTGHGNIDVIASYNADGRVSAKYCHALDDTEFRLNDDHFLVEAGFVVKEL